jgi:hypothetical protein
MYSMTNVNKRIFDELAHVLKSNRPGNALILQIADVCARANPNFHRDWFLQCSGYEQLTTKSKVLKLGNKMRAVPQYGTHFDMDGSQRPITKEEYDAQRQQDIADGWITPADAFKPEGEPK